MQAHRASSSARTTMPFSLAELSLLTSALQNTVLHPSHWGAKETRQANAMQLRLRKEHAARKADHLELSTTSPLPPLPVALSYADYLILTDIISSVLDQKVTTLDIMPHLKNRFDDAELLFMVLGAIS